MANDLINNDKRNSDAEAALPQGGTETNKRPFDTSGVNWVPDFDEADPPYQNWWVVEQDERDQDERDKERDKE